MTEMSGRLAGIEARIDAATPGPWTLCIIAEGNQSGRVEGVALDFTDTTYPDGGGFDFQSLSDADADLIAAAPTDLRDILEVAKAASDVLKAYDQADEMDWTGALVDTRLRAALANLEGGA